MINHTTTELVRKTAAMYGKEVEIHLAGSKKLRTQKLYKLITTAKSLFTSVMMPITPLLGSTTPIPVFNPLDLPLASTIKLFCPDTELATTFAARYVYFLNCKSESTLKESTPAFVTVSGISKFDLSLLYNASFAFKSESFTFLR